MKSVIMEAIAVMSGVLFFLGIAVLTAATIIYASWKLGIAELIFIFAGVIVICYWNQREY